jgi:hypothetical protein
MLETKEIITELISDLKSGKNFLELLIYLKRLKAIGVESDAANLLLNNIRNLDVSEEQEDVVLELMDVSSGYCGEHLKIW